jgi:hypothetical protein
MKTNRWPVIRVAILLITGGLVHADVVPGQSMQDVLTTLGPPAGLIRMGGHTWLSYDRGTVKLVDDQVTEADLVSPAIAQARREEQAALHARAVAAAAERTEVRIATGWTTKFARLGDPNFLSQPASVRLAYWQRFARTYPEIPVYEEMEFAAAEARRDLEQQRIANAQADRIRDLEDRIARAEAERERTRTVHVRYVSQPIVVIPAPACPVTPVIPPKCAITPVRYSPFATTGISSPTSLYRKNLVGISTAARLAHSY